MALTPTKLGMAVAAGLIMGAGYWSGIVDGSQSAATKGTAPKPYAGSAPNPPRDDLDAHLRSLAQSQVLDEWSVAAKRIRGAAEHGHVGAHENGRVWAQYSLGLMYKEGRGVPQDYVEAAKWFRRAAEQGLAMAEFVLAAIYEIGEGVPKDEDEAAKWYRKAAEQGLAVAQRSLGYMYAQGRGVPQDFAEAVRWYRMAAEQGLAEAQRELGGAYRRGEGVPQDYAEALKWFRRAAEQGHAPAYRNLGNMYANGEGVPQNYVKAYMWLDLAARFGSIFIDAGAQDWLAHEMTPRQIADAKRMARMWTQRHWGLRMWPLTGHERMGG